MRYAAKKDLNHKEIADAFEKTGCLVHDLSGAGNGWPDLLVCYRDVLRFVEIKNPKTTYGRKGLNKHQKKFAGSSVHIAIVKTVDDVLELVGQWRK